jgi:hypothetical protein
MFRNCVEKGFRNHPGCRWSRCAGTSATPREEARAGEPHVAPRGRLENASTAGPGHRPTVGRLCRSATLLAAAAATLALGCQGKPSSQSAGGARGRQVRVTGGGARGASADDIFGDSKSSAERLHDLSGPLLLYYAIHRRLPETLEDLASVADADRTPEFTSPASGKRLVYTPSAVPPPGQDRRLVLYDPTPTGARTYWAILMGYPRGDQPAATWVVELPEQALRSYAAATTQPAGDVP